MTAPLPPFKTDAAVLILFFNRPGFLEKTFESVRRARPSRLFLYQDGPRGEADLPALQACREVVSHIDWQCDVQTNYQTVNRGCDPSNYLAQRWAFSLSERVIVLEDDDIISESFIPFCAEMLERYANDTRIGMIAGLNIDEKTTDIADDDYFFTTNFSIWGWASWRRVFDKWQADYAWLDDPSAVSRIESLTAERRLRKDFLPMCRAHRASGKAFYETIFHSALLLESQLAIVPRVNMITNIGVTDDSTHFAGTLSTMPRGFRRIFTMGCHTLEFPLHHPVHIVDHVAYRRRVYRTMAWRHPMIKMGRSIEELWLNLRHGRWRRISHALFGRLSIILGGRKFK